MTTFDEQLRNAITRVVPIYDDPIGEVKALLHNRVLVGQVELADYCGVTRFTVQNWQRSIRHPLPEPAYRIGNGPAWWLDELEEWLSTNRNLLKTGSPALLALL